MKKMKMIGFAFLLVFAISFVSAQNVTVCCEKTLSNLYCQDVPAEQCAPDAKQVPTSCSATSYCRPGICFDSNEGTCLDSTPQNVCNQNNGVWSEKPVPQCELGCCVLGDQAAFVTLTRCKRLSSFLGLEPNYNKELNNEIACIASVAGQERGACVYESELQKSCRMTTRAECASAEDGEFFKGKLCAAEELATICAPTERTACIPGREEVYFVDSCGNPANIYDASKLKDKEYWSNMKNKAEACSPNSANADNPNCGNCNYLLGSFCRPTSSGTRSATYGENICADLNCQDTSNGNDYKHGESWCVYTDEGELDKGNNAVGSRYYKHICMNGEEIIEACADFRQHECIEDVIKYGDVEFSQAACRVNRWQDCYTQNSKTACENTDKRDCLWKPFSSSVRCVPKNSPGLKFWEGEEAQTICSQASVTCVATCEEDLFDNKECKGPCVDDEGEVDMGWWNEMSGICYAMGDCTDSGSTSINNKLNWIGQKGAR